MVADITIELAKYAISHVSSFLLASKFGFFGSGITKFMKNSTAF
jgi:hypothetical protein